MKSIAYIKKYKSNLNFNILKRLFVDDGIELTDEQLKNCFVEYCLSHKQFDHFEN